MAHPDTRPSLLCRLRDHGDEQAWDEFVRIYRPVIHRVAVAKGMQPADADDLTQQVLVSVSGAIAKFDPHRSGGRFRTWLRRIADNAIINALTRRQGDRGIGDGGVTRLLANHADDGSDESQLIETEFRRQLFLVAARSVKARTDPNNWAAFWRTTVEQDSVERVASELGKSTGAVYAARSRVMKRLRQQVQQLEEEA